VNKKIVISFPGARGTEIPLLYFGAKYYEDQGYEKIFINHPTLGEKNFESVYLYAKRVIESIDFSEYEDIVFIAKSMGTVVACKIKAELKLPASLILYTPISETLPYIHNNNQIILVAAGDKDRLLDSNILKEICVKENVPCYIESDVGHRMEVMNDLHRNLKVIANVVSRL